MKGGIGDKLTASFQKKLNLNRRWHGNARSECVLCVCCDILILS